MNIYIPIISNLKELFDLENQLASTIPQNALISFSLSMNSEILARFVEIQRQLWN